MDTININTEEIKEYICKLNKLYNYYQNKQATFSRYSFNASNTYLAQYLNNLKNDYSNISINIKNVKNYLQTYCDNIEGTELGMTERRGPQAEAEITSLLNQYKNIIEVIKIDNKALFNPNDMSTNLANNLNDMSINLANYPNDSPINIYNNWNIYLEETIDDLQLQQKELEDALSEFKNSDGGTIETWDEGGGSAIVPNAELFKEKFGYTLEEYDKKLETLKSQIYILKTYKHKIGQEIKEFPYLEMLKTEDFQNYCTECNNTPVKIPIVDYSLITNEQALLLNYLYDTKGLDAAKEYLEAIEEKINEAQGKKDAEAFLLSITDENGNINNDGLTWLETVGEGMESGLNNFFEGFANLFESEGKISSNQFKQMYIMEGLLESDCLTATYELSSNFGNMLIPMIISIIIGAAGAPKAASIVGNTLTGISVTGNAKNQALLSGNDQAHAIIYGLLNGVSETTLGLLLGNIPGLNASSALSIKGLLKEGTEEFLQEYVDAGLRSCILNEPIDISELNKDALKSFLYGVTMSLITNGGEVALNLIINGTQVKINNFDDFNTFIKMVTDSEITNDDGSIDLETIEEIGTVKTNKNPKVFYSDQSLPQQTSKNKFNKNKFNNYADIVRKNCPNITNAEIIEMFNNLNYEGCSCAAFANTIYEQYYTNDFDFYDNFGFSLKDKNGNIDINLLMVDIYSKLYNSAKVKIFKYDDYVFDSLDTATKKLLGKTFDNDSDRFAALVQNHYLGNGLDELGNLKIHHSIPTTETYYSSPNEIAKQVFGVEGINTFEELENLCKENNINISISDRKIQEKLTGLTGDNYNYWNKYYFDSHNLSNSLIESEISVKELGGDYSQLQEKLLTLSKDSTILISVGPNSDAQMHNNGILSWSKIGGKDAGHVMTFLGFDSNNDILVNSWGEQWIIPKEYFSILEYHSIKPSEMP